MIEAIFGVPIATALGLANLGVGTANLIATGSNRKELKALANHSKAEHQKIYNIFERVDMGIAAQSKLLQNQTDLLKAQSDNVLALNQRLYSTMFQQPTIPSASPTFTDDQLQTLMKYITG